MRLIKLTELNGDSLLINPNKIVAIDIIPCGSRIRASNYTFVVKETLEQIDDLLRINMEIISR